MSTDEVVADEVWEQDGPVGGSVDGITAPVAIPVVTQGVTITRDAPPLKATFGLLTCGSGSAAVRIGREPRRRRLLLSVRPNTTATAYVVVAENAQQAEGGYGLPILQGVAPVVLHYAGEVYVKGFGATDLTVGFLAELDEG